MTLTLAGAGEAMRTLTTSRLQLKKANAGSIRRLVDSDRALARTALSRPALRWLEALDALDPHDGGAWLICRRVAPKMIGLFAYQSKLAGGASEISYMILEGWRRKGYGLEAVRAACACLTDELETPVLFADVAIGNLASESILHRLDFSLLDMAERDITVGTERTAARRWVRPRPTPL